MFNVTSTFIACQNFALLSQSVLQLYILASTLSATVLSPLFFFFYSVFNSIDFYFEEKHARLLISNWITFLIRISTPYRVIFMTHLTKIYVIRFQQFCLRRDNAIYISIYSHIYIINSVVLWKIQKFEWLISNQCDMLCLHNIALCNETRINSSGAPKWQPSWTRDNKMAII